MKQRRGMRRVIAFAGRDGGVELRDLELLPPNHFEIALRVCSENGLDGFVDFDPGLDFIALVQHVQKGRALVSFPGAGSLWLSPETAAKLAIEAPTGACPE